MTADGLRLDGQRRVAELLEAAGDEVDRLQADLDRLRDEMQRRIKTLNHAERERLLRKGFDCAADNAQISQWDVWHITNPTLDLDLARKELDALVARELKKGLP